MEDLVPGKTGLYDESVMWDTDPWILPWFARLTVGRRPEELLWPFSHADHLLLFEKVTSLLQLHALRPCLYALRHGGASDDLLTGRRSVMEVKRRGGWAAESSVKRYAKE